MRDVQVGERVGAISHTTKDTVYLFGYGVYEGNFVREGPGLFGEADKEAAYAEAYYREQEPEATDEQVKAFVDLVLTNPRIRLDSGKVVWGAQCWWGPEAEVKAAIGRRQTVYVDVGEEIERLRAVPVARIP